MEPWQFYFAELRRRTERIPPRGPGRDEMLAEAAHDAYQVTTDHLTREGWDDEKALTITRMFGQAVKDWIARGGDNWDVLNQDLGRRYNQWTDQRGGA